jgi:predicted nucleic acid-binding protein
MLVVSDTGPIISLAILGKLDLLESLYNDVIIPEEVWRELERNMEKLPINAALRFKERVVPVTKRREIDAPIEPGEKEAILLYEEHHADRLLLEDQEGRRYAEACGIVCTGTLGVLELAKRRGLIGEMRPLLAALLENRRHYSRRLLDSFLILHNELPL